RDLLQIEPADAMCAETQSSFELHRNPLRILAHFDREAFRVRGNARLLSGHVRPDLDIEPQFLARSVAQRIFGPGNVGMKRRPIALNRHAHAALAKLVPAGASGAEAKSSLAALQVRDAHPGKQ